MLGRRSKIFSISLLVLTVSLVFGKIDAEAQPPEQDKIQENEKIIWQDDFKRISAWDVSIHKDGEPAKAAKDDYLIEEGDYQGKKPAFLHYNFTTSGQDACMITREVKIKGGDLLRLIMYGDKSNHGLFLMVVDKTGEKHFKELGNVSFEGWREFEVDISNIYFSPPKGQIESYSERGDRNQKVDLPIRSITMGISDNPDAFTGKGKIGLAKIEFIDTGRKLKRNIIRNGGFERGLYGWIPCRVKKSTTVRISDMSHLGFSSLCIESDSNAGGAIIKYMSFPAKVYLEPGEKYRFSCYLKAEELEGKVNPLTTHIPNTGAKKCRGTEKGWQYYENILTVPVKVPHYIRICPISLHGKGRVFIDDIRLEAMKDE